MFCQKIVYSSLPVLTLLCVFSATNALNATVTLSKRVFEEGREKVEVKLFTGRNTTLYDALVEAARVNDKFKFTGIKYSFGYYIDSIGGLAENRNKSLYWYLYKKTVSGEEFLQTGVSSTIVAENEHYLFWYKSGSHSKLDKDPPVYKRIWSVMKSIFDFVKNKF